VKHLDLFSGIGGFALAARWVGWETVGFCEIESYCQKVLKKHWPDVPIYDDIRKLTGEQVGPVDIITAGFPCQDVSVAGKGAGIDWERSGLWREAARIIGELRPRYALLENVAALLGRGMGRVLGDLAEVGYDAEWEIISAASLGANHRRDRAFILAYPRGEREQRIIPQKIPEQRAFSWCKDVGRLEDLPERCDLYKSRLSRSPNGLSKEVGAYGNAIVPQVAEVIFRAIDEMHKMQSRQASG
jgi:DNA (cytosine-5)-methyltransferase 1